MEHVLAECKWNCPTLHKSRQGEISTWNRTRTVVTGCLPIIMNYADLQVSPPFNWKQPVVCCSPTQIALGCTDGCVWVLVDFNIDTSSPYSNVGHPITHLRKVSAHHNYLLSAGPSDDGVVDLLVCGGHFHSLKVFQHGKVRVLNCCGL